MKVEASHLHEPQGSNQLTELLKRPSEITTVLFDMDGLLVNTEILCIRVAIAICRDLNSILKSPTVRSRDGVIPASFEGAV